MPVAMHFLNVHSILQYPTGITSGNTRVTVSSNVILRLSEELLCKVPLRNMRSVIVTRSEAV